MVFLPAKTLRSEVLGGAVEAACWPSGIDDEVVCTSAIWQVLGGVTEWAGYKVRDCLTGAASSQKYIFSGEEPGGGNCVLSFAQRRHQQAALRREAKILSNVGNHPNVITYVDFIEDWGGMGGLVCLIVEMVTPLGYDLFEVVRQHLGMCRPMPQHAVQHYVRQVAGGLRHLHSQGISHRDLKPEQVLVNEQQEAKIIDFGLAESAQQGVTFMVDDELGCLPPYLAPELRSSTGDARADLWGLGVIIYFLCIGQQPMTQQIETWCAKGTFSKRLASMGVHSKSLDAIVGLLEPNPAKRWTLNDVEEWAVVEVGYMQPKLNLTVQCPLAQLQRWPCRNDVPAVFAARLPRTFRSGQSIGQLELSSHGFLVLLVVRNSHWREYYNRNGRLAYENVITGTTAWPHMVQNRPQIINVPRASTLLNAGDIIVCGVKARVLGAVEDWIPKDQINFMRKRLGILPDEESCNDAVAVAPLWAARRREHEGLIQDLPEFDVTLPLPGWCEHALLGPASASALGQNALDLRNVFGMSLAGLVHKDGSVTWWPGADQAVKPGDRGLVVRMPRWTSEAPFASAPTVDSETLLKLMKEELFRKCLGLEDPISWGLWLCNATRGASAGA
mmetsp:Transcript_115021/g.245657  ORF Transcript_115021/g.245657 Transcript_115021/m.245657 type:complete len:615 (-) Transcript_115021:301-2145(-)